jgi:hypothetical protein
MWRRFQAVMVVFFALVAVAEFWRAYTTDIHLRVHAFIDGVVCCYLVAVAFRDGGRELLKSSVMVTSLVIVGFVAWGLIHL